MASARDPREVATVIATALERGGRASAIRSAPRPGSVTLMRGIVPTRAQRWLVTRLLGLKPT